MNQELPQGWVEVGVGTVLNLINGFAFKPSQWGKTGLPIIRIQNLNNPDAPFNFYDGALPEKVRVRRGDLLFAWSGTPGTSFGSHIWNGGESWLNQHIFRVEFDPNLFHKIFLRHAINQNLERYIAQAHGGAGLAHITKGMFEAALLKLPPLAEQQRIVAKLEVLLGKVDACRKRLEKIPIILKRFRQSVLATACSGRLTADWREELPVPGLERGDRQDELPDSWATVEFGQLIADGPQNGLYKPSEFYGNGTLIVRIDAFYDGTIAAWGELKRLRLTEKERMQFALVNNDILINRVNSPKFLGKAALVRSLSEPCVYESNMMRLRLDVSRVRPDYTILYLQSLAGLVELRKNAKHAINQSSINQEDVKSANFNLPPLTEQHEIVRRVEALFALADNIETRYAKAKTHVDRLTQSILAKAFRGDLVPQDPSDEPASLLLGRISLRRQEEGAPRRQPRRMCGPHTTD